MTRLRLICDVADMRYIHDCAQVSAPSCMGTPHPLAVFVKKAAWRLVATHDRVCDGPTW
jgi:hypothetical protein